MQQQDSVYLLELPTAAASLCADGNRASAQERLRKSKLTTVKEVDHSEADPGITGALLEAVAAFE